MALTVRTKVFIGACVAAALVALVYYDKRRGSKFVMETIWSFRMTSQEGIHGSFNPHRYAQHRKFLDYTRSVLDQNLHPEELLNKTLLNEQWKRGLYGTIWPRDDYNETELRIEEQMEFLNLYHRIKNRTGGVKKPKIILGHGSLNLETFRVGKTGQEIFANEGCPENWCIATRNLTKYAQTADAVVFSKTYGIKPHRNPKQIWIAQHFESPYHNRIDTMYMRYHVNWSVTYRRESSVVINYGTYRKNKTVDASSLPYVNYAQNKTKQVAMLVSNCYSKNDRLQFAKVLGTFMQVDIYGSCGPYRCGVGGSSSVCGKWLSQKYKFYLAFENSNCKDYITEKLLMNTLLHNMVPVVYGARKEDYEAVAPPNSFIYAKDFPSIRALADYLIMLDKNDDLYNEYFRWKGTYYFLNQFRNQRHWCRVCTLLHLQSDVGYVHYYDDYRLWWHSACRNGGRRPPTN